MKRIFTIAALLLSSMIVFSQSIPNGDMEHWHTVIVNPNLSYEDIGSGPTDNWTATLNSLVAVPPLAGGPGPVTVYKTTDKYSGTYAARAVSKNFQLGPVTVFVPGMIGTAKINNATVSAILGQPCADCKPLRLKGYFKFEPVDGDSCGAMILLSKWNAVAKKRDTVGYGAFIQKDAVSEYKAFEVPVNYWNTGSVDSITILVVASAGFNVYNFMGCVGKENSTMYLDDLTIDYPAGIQQVLLPEVRVEVFPNPVSDVLNVRLSKKVQDGTFEIYSTGGKLTRSIPVREDQFTLPVTDLTNGSYYFRLLEGSALQNTGSFVINR